MSRKDSRSSIGTRQPDALAEYENRKKRFLISNKHITKLNSELSVRVDELSNEIRNLQGENLRLRQTVISVVAQLKREREKSRKILADTEIATLSLTKHLSYLRQTYNITVEPTPPPSPAFPPPKKPSHDTIDACYPGFRVSRPPAFPDIHEEDEPCRSSSELENDPKSSTDKRKTKTKSRLSASKLPLPSRANSPPSAAHVPDMTPMPSRVDYASSSGSAKRKSSRRQSGLLSIDTENLAPPRPASPAFGSPIRLEAGRAEEAEQIAVASGDLQVDMEPEPRDHDSLMPPPLPKKEKRKYREKDPEDDKGREYAVDSLRSREKKRQREDDDNFLPEGTKGKLREMTNSRAVLQPIDLNIVRDQEDVVVSTRTFLVPSSPTASGPSQPPIPPPPEPEPEPESAAGGRERRARKSINYAEPKLNTKMRKPDPPSGAEAPRLKKRSSAAAALTALHAKLPELPPLPGDFEPTSRSSGEFLVRNLQGDVIHPEEYPLPPSRPQSALYYTPVPPPPPSSRTSTSSSSSGAAAAGAVKRKKSKPIIASDDEESDGAQADAEFIPSGRLSGWINVEGRQRRSGERERSKKTSLVMLGETKRELVDERRHSMAV